MSVNLSWKWRAGLALLLGVPILALAMLPLWRPPAPTSVASVQRLNNAQCQTCHQAVWDEWTQSRHSQTWVSPTVQAAFAHFGHDRQCESCHAPEPVFVAGLTAPIQLRSEHRDSGIDCLTCHLRADGKIAALQTRTDVPCLPVLTTELSNSEQCGGCHRAIFDDWQVSRYAREQITCQACHMRERNEPGTHPDALSKRTHLCLGGHDDDLVRSGVRVSYERSDQELTVQVTNHATGHNFPGERHNRMLLLELMVRTADGEVLQTEQRIIKGITPFRGESSSEQIRADQTHRSVFALPPEANSVHVQLLYKRFPWMATRDALVVSEWKWTKP